MWCLYLDVVLWLSVHRNSRYRLKHIDHRHKPTTIIKTHMTLTLSTPSPAQQTHLIMDLTHEIARYTNLNTMMSYASMSRLLRFSLSVKLVTTAVKACISDEIETYQLYDYLSCKEEVNHPIILIQILPNITIEQAIKVFSLLPTHTSYRLLVSICEWLKYDNIEAYIENIWEDNDFDHNLATFLFDNEHQVDAIMIEEVALNKADTYDYPLQSTLAYMMSSYIDNKLDDGLCVDEIKDTLLWSKGFVLNFIDIRDCVPDDHPEEQAIIAAMNTVIDTYHVLWPSL